jgi:hypothetical protein
MEVQKKPVFLIYYRELPCSVTFFLAANKKFSYIKDGVQPVNEHRVPRITIQKEPEPDHIEIPTLERFDSILKELLSNNQIVSYKMIKKI